MGILDEGGDALGPPGDGDGDQGQPMAIQRAAQEAAPARTRWPPRGRRQRATAELKHNHEDSKTQKAHEEEPAEIAEIAEDTFWAS